MVLRAKININPGTTRPKLNEKATTGGGGVVTTRYFLLQVIKNLCMLTVQVIDTSKLLDIVLLLIFTKFINIAFSWNGSDLKLFFLF